MKSFFDAEETLLMPVATLPGKPREKDEDGLENVSYEEEDKDLGGDFDDEDELSDLDEEDEL